MSSAGDRHRKGPGGPTRPARSGRVTPPSSSRRRHRPQASGLLDPTVERMVSTLLDTARSAVPAGHPAPGVPLEQWAIELAGTPFDDEAMPREFYVDLSRTLVASDDRLAPAALAALAIALHHRDAAPLRRARSEWLAATPPGDQDVDLGIGREVAVGAITIGAVDGPQVSLLIGFSAAGAGHAMGLLVDDALDGLGRDLFVGPDLEVVRADARADPDLIVTDIPVAEAARRARAALAVTATESWDDAQDLATLPLLTRRLALLPTT